MQREATCFEHQIARLMTKTVIELFELVHIQHQNGHRRLVALRTLEFMFGHIEEFAAGQHPCQRIGVRQSLDRGKQA